MKINLSKLSKKNQIISGVGLLILIIIGLLSYIFLSKTTNIEEEKVKSISYSFKQCQSIESDEMLTYCNTKYSISKLQISYNNCKEVFTKTKDGFSDRYINLDSYENKKKQCSDAYLGNDFKEKTFFDPNNNFKSTIDIVFKQEFFTDLQEKTGTGFIENRIKAKQKLLSLLEIEPKVNLSIDDIVLYPKKGSLVLDLEPLKKYSIKLKSYKTSMGVDSKESIFSFKTPENKFFKIKIQNPVSLYRDTTPPRFELQEFNTKKQKAGVKICRIDNETYAKIEVLRKQKQTSEIKDFFLNKIDNLKAFDCKEKEVVFNEKSEKEDGVLNFRKQVFDFDDLIGKPARSGLYFVTFSNYIDREFNEKIQYPIFFGIIDSHITMKVSKNGEGFFFVNDFDGNPLEGQKIRVYLNDFKNHEKKYDRAIDDYKTTIFSPLDKQVFSTGIVLGTTDKSGILKVSLNDKVSDAFGRTFEDWYYENYKGTYKSFFVTSASKTNLTYVNSRWNAGIAPENFGYSIDTGWWGDRDENDIKLSRWGRVEPEYYSHTYTDRVLYLPGEEVNFKSIIRKTSDLSVPENKDFSLSIKDSNGKEIFNKKLKVNEFGSINDKLVLTKDAPLGSYNIRLKENDKQIGYSTFSVEVFKNPKFKNEINLQAFGLESGMVKIDSEKKVNSRRTDYTGKFELKADIFSKYYNGANVKNASYSYKIFKQPYRDNAWWTDCFYGCYREPRKELYTRGEGKTDENGQASLTIPVDFKSDYEDYKYIFEVSVTDNAGDKISGSNSIIAKLPNEYKKRNRNSSLYFETANNFYKAGEYIDITGGLNSGKWSKYYDDKYLFIIKKKDYEVKEVNDVRGTKRPINKVVEKIEKVLLVNSENFSVSKDGKLKLKYKLKETGEYVFEYAKITSPQPSPQGEGVEQWAQKIEEYISIFNKTQSGSILVNKTIKDELRERKNNIIENPCEKIEKCSFTETWEEVMSDEPFTGKVFNITKTIQENIKLSDLLETRQKKYFTTLVYGKSDAKNPAYDDNKIKVLSEKVAYKLGEKARFLIRLPFSKGKILWTVEKQGVLKSELIDVESNIFFKEIVVDDSFVPNAYVGVIAIDTNGKEIPEYKVGYAEIVVDKTDKKVTIDIESNKKTYKPREEVTLDFKVKDKWVKNKKSELSVMVVDDSLISLMGNVDLNLIDKFFKKLSFQTQTSLTNLAMLKNYYFSRPGIVGGSGFGNFKGGDSAVSSRNVFKNTAYYNPSVITDKYGNAQVKFELPDNLTNFRVIVVANGKDNFFGASEEFIEVRKNVILEDKTPIILRDGDKLKVGANLFNTTDKEIGFKVNLSSYDLDVKNPEQNITVKAGNSKFIEWEVTNKGNKKILNYKITALGDSSENSDKLQNKIEIKESPVLITNKIKSKTLEKADKKELEIILGDNVSIDKSKVELVLSNNRLNGIEKIVSSLAKYPYGCIEQTTSSTYPNAILKKFNDIFSGIVETDKIDTNIEAGIERIIGMQTSNGGFGYWPGDTSSNLRITPYVLRSLIDMKEIGASVSDKSIEKAVRYLENNYKKASGNLEKSEILWALAKYGNIETSLKNIGIANLTDSFMYEKNLDRHTLIAWTYSLVLADKKKYKFEIESNIKKIKTKLADSESSSRYRNDLSDKSIFASMLIDYSYDLTYVDTIISELYDRDWSSYYYSTQAKNNAFMAFAKYIESYGKNKYNKGTYLFSNGTKDTFELGKNSKNIYKKEFSLKDVYKDGKINLTVDNKNGKNMFVDLILKEYPKDKTKVKETFSGMKINREIFKVLEDGECKQELKHSGDNFKKGQLYKVNVTISFDEDKRRQNVSIEDYLPASFRVINDKFKTESSDIRQNTSRGRTWDHREFKPEVVFVNTSNIWGKNATFTYYFRAEFEGTFTYPPATSYMMYDPKVRSNSTYKMINVGDSDGLSDICNEK